MSSFITGYIMGQQSVSVPVSSSLSSASAAGAAISASLENDRLAKKNQELAKENWKLREQNVNLRAHLAGYMDLSRRLHDVLNEVAPDHPLADWDEQYRIARETSDKEFKKIVEAEYRR